MIHIITISSSIIEDIESFKEIIQEIENIKQAKDKIIITISAYKNEKSTTLENILKLNINTTAKLIDSIMVFNEQKSAYYLSLYLDLNDIKNQVLTATQIPILTNNDFGNSVIEHIEINSILETLTKNEIVIIPSNQGITRKLEATTFGNNGSDLTALYIYKELIRRRLKTKCHIYKMIDGIYLLDKYESITDNLIDEVKLSSNNPEHLKSLNNLLSTNAINLIKKYQLTLTIGKKIYQGTKIKF